MHKEHTTPQWRLIFVYVVVAAMAFIYYHYIVSNHGDIISKIPGIWYVEDCKGVDKTKKSDVSNSDGFTPASGYYLIDGWTAVRVAIYAAIGYANPHAHVSTFVISCLKETYAGSCKNSSRPLHNPIVSMIGYTIGSALCPGVCI